MLERVKNQVFRHQRGSASAKRIDRRGKEENFSVADVIAFDIEIRLPKNQEKKKKSGEQHVVFVVFEQSKEFLNHFFRIKICSISKKKPVAISRRRVVLRLRQI